MKTKEKVRKLDKYLRDKTGATANDFVKAYCPVLAEHAYATRDGSINEMEKTLCHVVGQLIYYKRLTEILGFGDIDKGFDPRKFVNAYEEREAVREMELRSASQLLLKQALDS